VAGREQALLLEALRFLGQNPPPELAGCSCAALLEWGVAHFKPLNHSAQDNELVF
jgi:hypothetical protein